MGVAVFVVLAQEIAAEVALEVVPDAVDVIGVVVVSMPAFDRPRKSSFSVLAQGFWAIQRIGAVLRPEAAFSRAQAARGRCPRA